MDAKSDFYQLLLIEVLENLTNQYDDNYDERRFGKKRENKLSWKTSLREIIEKRLKKTSLFIVDASCKQALELLKPYMEDLSLLYQTLSDDSSKQLLVQLIAYRILGYKRYKLPLSTPNYWQGINRIDKLKDDQDYLTVKYPGRPLLLYKFDLRKLNVPITVYNTSGGVYSGLNVKQYEYVTDETSIKPERGDIVLDCGACWGEVALFFAHEVNKEGHVYSFEFVTDNINIYNKNHY